MKYGFYRQYRRFGCPPWQAAWRAFRIGYRKWLEESSA